MSSRGDAELDVRQNRIVIKRRVATILAAIIVLGVLLGPMGGAPIKQAHAVTTFTPGDVFVAVESGKVNWYHGDGTFVATLDTGLGGFTTGMSFDSSGKLYVTDFSVDAASVFYTNGTLAGTFGSGYLTPESIVFNAAGDVYVGNLDNGILKFNSSGSPAGNPYTGRVDWFDIKADQCTALFTTEGDEINTVDVCTGTVGSNFVTGTSGTDAFALRIRPAGDVLLADGSQIERFNSTGAQVQVYDAPGENSWFALNLDPDGTSFWSADFTTGDVFKFDVATGAVLKSFNTGTGSDTVFGLAVFGEFTAATEICGNGIDDDGDGLIDEGCPAANLEIHKFVQLNQTGINIDESITFFQHAKVVEATLVEPDKTTIHAYHVIPKDLPGTILFTDPGWDPLVTFADKNGKWELKLQLIATYQDGKTHELKNIEQKIIIQFDVVCDAAGHCGISMPTGSNTLDLNKDIVISPHPAQLKGDMTIKIGENITGQTKVLVAEVSLSKPSGEVVSYTTLPVDITTGSVTIPFPGTGWVSSDGKPSLDQAGLWQMDIEIIGFYQDGTLAIKKINQKLWIDFNVIPESMIGTIALIGSSLGGFVAFRRIRAKNNGSDGKPKRSGTSLGI